jgi:hypothetical protein
MAKEPRVDAKAFLLERETLRDRLSYVRAYSLADAKRRKPWWLMLPIFPVAGWLLTKGSGSNGNGHHPHPILKSFVTALVLKLLETVTKGVPDNGRPSILKTLFR